MKQEMKAEWIVPNPPKEIEVKTGFAGDRSTESYCYNRVS